MKKTSLFLSVVIALMIGCAGSPFSAPKGPSEEQPTEVIHYMPPNLPRAEHSGYCWTNSIAASRKDAWRCMVGNQIFDPCFTRGRSVICGADPATGGQGFLLALSRPLPAPDAAAVGEENTGWLIELPGGIFCNRATGARGIVEGQMTTYYCTSRSNDDSTAVLGELKTGRVWTADVAVIDRTTGKIRERKFLPVVRVWQ